MNLKPARFYGAEQAFSRGEDTIMATQAMDFDVDESDDEAPSKLRFELRHFKTGDDTEDTPVSYWLEQGVTM